MQRAMRVICVSDNLGSDSGLVNRIWQFSLRGVGSACLREVEYCEMRGSSRGVSGKSGSWAAALHTRVAFSFYGDVRARFFCELLHKHCAMGACVVIKLVLRVPAIRS
jgi:hypothetical protein